MKKTDRYWIIGVSFLPAIILAMIPLPTWLQPWRPSWVPMVLAYWCMALPDHVSLLVVWGVGLLLDIYQGRLLGHKQFVSGIIFICCYRCISPPAGFIYSASIIIYFLVFVFV